MDKYEQSIRTVMVALAGVKAEGPDNWNRLLACHQVLENLLVEMANDKQNEKQEA